MSATLHQHARRGLSNAEKMLLHIYAQAAKLNDPTYRQVLRTSAGCSSATDPHFDQTGFEHTMANLETMLWQRVADKQVPDPRPHRYIKGEFYWRDRVPALGRLSNRHKYMIDLLYGQLLPHLPANAARDGYLERIVHKAVGRAAAIHELNNREAGYVINALRDRLAYAIRRGPESTPAAAVNPEEPLHE